MSPKQQCDHSQLLIEKIAKDATEKGNSGKVLEESGPAWYTLSRDAVVMSTVLCCMPDRKETSKLMSEILRVLKKKGVLYVTDFLICDHPKYNEKYAQGMQKFGEWGIYTTNENLTVRHYTARAIMELLKEFEVEWFEQFDFKTMNQNPARTFHCIARRTVH